MDVGANVGMYTIAVAKLNGNGIVIHSFEPDKKNFLGLQNGTYINNLSTQIFLNNMAVSDKKGEINFYVSTTNPGDHRIAPSTEEREVVTVPTTTLDEYFKNIPLRNVLVKMDIQGAEYVAFKGFRETLGRITGDLAILMEFWPAGLKSAGATTDEMIGLMEEIGGEIFLIDEKTSSLFRVDIPWIRNYCVTTLTIESQWDANFLITRPSRMLASVTSGFLNTGK